MEIITTSRVTRLAIITTAPGLLVQLGAAPARAPVNSQIVAVGHAASTAAVYGPTIAAAGGISVSVGAAPSVASVPGPSISLGGIVVAVGSIASVSAVAGPMVVAPPPSHTVLFSGDSITAYSIPNGGWPSYARIIEGSTPSKTFRNSAVGGSSLGNPGDTSGNTCYARIADDLTFGPGVAVLFIGANELPSGAPSVQAAYAERCFVYLDQFKAIGSRVVICTVLERADNTSFTPAMRSSLNGILRAGKASGRVDDVIDFDLSVAGADGATANAAIFPDGVHPSASAQTDMANVARPVVYHWLAIPNEPVGFSFAPVAAATPDTDYDSPVYTVMGLYPAETRPYSVQAGNFVRKNGGAWVLNGSGTVVNGDTLQVRNHSSASDVTQTDVTLTIGSTIATYSVTTAGAGSRDWVPTDLGAKLAMWVIPETLTGEDDTDVTAWADQSGNGNNLAGASATGGSGRPRLSSGINGYKAVKFDGPAQSKLNAPAGLTTGRASMATFFVSKNVSDPNTAYFGAPISGWGSNSDDYWPFANGGIYTGYGRADRLDNMDPPAAMTGWHQYMLLSAPSNWRIAQNGTDVFTSASNTVSPGGSPTLGYSAGISAPFDGSVGEVVDLNAAPTTTERQLVEGYLAWKFGLQASLPGDHPYKTAKPTI